MNVEKIIVNNITINKTSKEASWRLVYDDNKVIDLFYSEGYTESVYNIFLANSKEACLAEIYKLNLEYSPK